MKNRVVSVAVVVFVLMGATMAFLATQQSRQKLGRPGVRVVAEPMYYAEPPGSTNPPAVVSSNRVFFPMQVLDYRSQSAPTPRTSVQMLPDDTLFGHRQYWRTNGLMIDCQAVLMGADRSSIHKAEFCLRGAGFETVATEYTAVPIPKPHAYDLPVRKFKIRKMVPDEQGRPREQAGVMVFWYVADGELITSRWDQMTWFNTRDMLASGVMQRWAYVICFAPCPPGAEEATFAVMKEFLAAAVPEFQLAAGPALTASR